MVAGASWARVPCGCTGGGKGGERGKSGASHGFGCVPHRATLKPLPDHVFGPPPDLSPSLRAACDVVWPPTPVSVAVFLLQRYLGFALGSGLQGNPEVRLGRGARVLNARRHCELRTGERLCLPLAGPGLPFLFPRLMDDSSTPPCVTPFLAISGENPWHARWPRLLTGGLGTKRNKGRAAQCMEGTVQAQRGQGAESQRAPGPTLALEAEHAWPPVPATAPHQRERRPSPEALSLLPQARVWASSPQSTVHSRDPAHRRLARDRA